MTAISATPTSLLPENGLMTGRSGFPKEAGARRAGSATTNRQQAYPPVTRSSHRAGAGNRHEGTAWLNEEEQRHDPGQRLASMFEKAEPALRFGMAVAIVVRHGRCNRILLEPELRGTSPSHRRGTDGTCEQRSRGVHPQPDLDGNPRTRCLHRHAPTHTQ